MADWQQPPQPSWEQGWQQQQPSSTDGGWGSQQTQANVHPQSGWQPQPQQQQWQAPAQVAQPWSGYTQQAQAQPAWGTQYPASIPAQPSQPTPPGFNVPNFQIPQYDFGNPMLNAGLQTGAHMMQEQAGIAMKKYIPGFWGSLKKYFYVNNAFVTKKLSALIFPFVKKDWARSPSMEPPANDMNSPDLYIPAMALSTYVLTVGLAKGSSMTFDPEVIVDTFGTSVMIQLVQVALLRIALIVFVPWVNNIPWIELLAFSGYQFVGVAINMLVGLLFGSLFYNLCLIWTASCTAFVMTQTMRSAVPPPEPGQRGKRRRVNFLIVAAVLQVLVMWFLGYTRELRSGGIFLSSGVASVNDVPPPVVQTRENVVVDRNEPVLKQSEPPERIEAEPEASRETASAPRRTGKKQKRSRGSDDSTDV